MMLAHWVKKRRKKKYNTTSNTGDAKAALATKTGDRVQDKQKE